MKYIIAIALLITANQMMGQALDSCWTWKNKMICRHEISREYQGVLVEDASGYRHGPEPIIKYKYDTTDLIKRNNQNNTIDLTVKQYDSLIVYNSNSAIGRSYAGVRGLIVWSNGRIDLTDDTLLVIRVLVKSYDSLLNRYWTLQPYVEDIINKLPNVMVEKEKIAYVKAVQRYYDFVYGKHKNKKR